MPPVKGRLDGLPMALKKRSNLWVMSLCMMPTITANHSKNPVSCQLITDQCWEFPLSPQFLSPEYDIHLYCPSANDN